MRVLSSVAAAALAVTALAVPSVLAQGDDTPEIKVTTTFPGNPLSLVKNGQANTVVFNIQNPPSQDRVLTLEAITGAWLDSKKVDGQRGRVVRNMTTHPYKSLSLRSVAGKPLEVPYQFFPEFRPQNMGVEFRLIVADGQTGKKHNLQAYEGSVTVIEPPKNWLDPQLWTVYLLGLAIVAGIGYFVQQTYFPAARPRKGPTGGNPAASQSLKSAAATTGTMVGQKYDEDWIPEHHLKGRRRGGAEGALSSGDESAKNKRSGRK